MAMVDIMYQDIEVMTRRLELEKRRLDRLDKELAAARQACGARADQSSIVSVHAGDGAIVRSRGSSRSRARSLSARGAPAVSALQDPSVLPVGTLEYRLDQKLKQLYTLKHGNGQMKEEINHIRKQRLQLNSVFERLKAQIRHKESQLVDCVEDTAASEDVDNDVKHRLAALQRIREMERSKFEGEVHKFRKDIKNWEWEQREVEVQLKRSENGIRKRRQFQEPQKCPSCQRGTSRSISDAKSNLAKCPCGTSFCWQCGRKVREMDWAETDRDGKDGHRCPRWTGSADQTQLKKHEYVEEKREVQRKKELIVPEEERDFSEASMMRRIMKTAFLNCIQRRHIKQHQKEIERFEQAFATIKASTGISDIEEIVRIFVNLETKSYSLLTYVNEMNREMEMLEVLKKSRKAAEQEVREREEGLEHQRHNALAGGDVKLHNMRFAVDKGRESYAQNRRVLERIQAPIRQMAKELHEIIGLQPQDALYKLPPELCEETIAEWLDWIEHALGRFRDLLPAQGREQAFPATVAASVKQLGNKRHGAPSAKPQIRAQDLPTSFSLTAAEALQESLGPVKRVYGGLTAAQKAELLDEEHEEEDFGDRPLLLREIRSRAEQSTQRRMRRQVLKQQSLSTPETSPAARLSPRAGAFGSRQGSPSRGPGGGGARDAEPFAALREGQRAETIEEADEGEAEGEASEHSSSSRLGDSDTTSSASGFGRAEDVEATLPEGRRRVRKVAIRASLQRRATDFLEEPLEGSDHGEGPEDADVAFLRRYGLSREEMQAMAERLDLQLGHLCFLKQEFDSHDADRSGYIDAAELRGLLSKLGEDIDEEELEAAFKVLDADSSGEIEFFEFVEWFTSGGEGSMEEEQENSEK